VLVPGNHDAPLTRAWVRAQGAALSVASPVDLQATRALGRVVSWLGPTTVGVNYPGTWLSEHIYATHGHYLDRHLIPDSAIGLPRGRLRRACSDHVSPVAYELGRFRAPRRDSGWQRAVSRPLGAAVDAAAHRVRAGVLPRLGPVLMTAGLAPVSAVLLDAQMRHAALPALDAEGLLAPENLVIVTGDHGTPSGTGLVHSGDAVPIAMVGAGTFADDVTAFDERSCSSGSLGHLEGRDLMPEALNRIARIKYMSAKLTPRGGAYWPERTEPLRLVVHDDRD